MRLPICCDRADPPVTRGIRVSCLGTVGENVLFGAALAGFDEVILISGSCGRCHLRPGGDLVRVSVSRASALARGAGLGDVSFATVEKEKVTRVPVGRREMFADLADRLKTGVRAISPEGGRSITERALMERGFDRDDGTGGSAARRLLRTLLSTKTWDGACPVVFNSESPWARVTVDNDRCTACGTCESVCPTAAIEIVEEGENRILSFMPSACMNCSLCREACIEDALDFEDEIRIADILQDKAEVIASVRPSWCAVCGDSIPAKTGETCPTCERRQVSTAHLRA